MTWEKGRPVIESMLERKHLERVTASPEDAEHLLSRARRHLETAADLADDDPEIAYDALYAAARKALTAILQQQGLRPTRAGGHEAVIEAAEAQLIPPLAEVLRPFRYLRRTRGSGDYLAAAGALSPEDVRSSLPDAIAIVAAASKIVPEMSVFIPTGTQSS